MRQRQQAWRERLGAGRRAKAGGSRVKPGPRRMLLDGLRTGRLGALLLLGFAMWALFYVLSAPRFVVHSVEVRNVDLQSPARLVELAGVQGRSLWLVDPAQVASNVGRSSYVEGTHISLELPDRVIISVDERQPAMRWHAGGREYLVDSTGLVLGPAPQADPQALVVYDTSHSVLQDGDQLDGDALILAHILSVRLPDELKLKPKRVEWDIGYGISVITEKDQQIAFGRKDDPKVALDVKIATLKTLLSNGTEFRFLDLRPALPYYR